MFKDDYQVVKNERQDLVNLKFKIFAKRWLFRLHCLNRIRKVFYGSTLEEMGGTYSNFTRHNGKLIC